MTERMLASLSRRRSTSAASSAESPWPFRSPTDHMHQSSSTVLLRCLVAWPFVSTKLITVSPVRHPIRCLNHSRATKRGQRMWKRKALCSKGSPVAIPHQKADQPHVGLLHPLLPLREADAGRVHDRQVARHGVVEAHEPVLEETDLASDSHEP